MKRISRDVFSRIALLWRCLWFVKWYDKPHVKQAQLDINALSSAKLKIQKFVLESHKFSLKTVWGRPGLLVNMPLAIVSFTEPV